MVSTAKSNVNIGQFIYFRSLCFAYFWRIKVITLVTFSP